MLGQPYLVVVAIVGLLVYLVQYPPKAAKASEVGRILLWTALLAIFLGR